MEYIEMTAAPKGMFDKMISSDGLRVPFSTNGPVGTGYRPMPLPVFSHGKSLSSAAMSPVPPPGSGSDLSRRGGMSSFASTAMSLKGSHMALVNSGNGGLGMMHLHLPSETGSPLHGDDLLDKGKRSRGEGGRGSRGGGTSSRKRTRAGQADSLTTTEAMPDCSLSGGAVASAVASAGRTLAGNGNRQRQNSSGDKVEKSTCRRQSGQGTKRAAEKKQPPTVATSVNDPIPPQVPEENGICNVWSSGILDIYGLRTRTMDVSRFMVDISLDDLLSGNFEVPSFSLKEDHEIKEPEGSFEQQIDSVLHLLPKRAARGEANLSKVGDTPASVEAKGPKNPKMLLDLECALHMEEEEGASREAKSEKGMRNNGAPSIKLEDEVEKDGRMDSTAVRADGLFSSQGRSKFAVDGLPVHSVETFLSRLKLAPSDPLLSIGIPGADGETSGSADNPTNGDAVELCHKNGSVPPLSASFPPVGPFKVENSRYNPRIWIRGPVAENSARKSGSGAGVKEGEEDAGASSPSSRPRIQDKLQSPEAMPVSSLGMSLFFPSQLGNPSMVDPAACVKEEPRQVDNAVGLSSEGDANPMEIDSDRLDTGSVAAHGADVTERTQVNPEHERQKGVGEAVRPMESPATLAGPQEMDVSLDRHGKTLTSTLADVKREKLEQAPKDSGEGSEGTRQDPVTARQETSLPPLDLKINVRSPSPLRNDSSSSLPAMPSSPGAQAAARLLCSMANSTYHPEPEKVETEKEKRRRVFQPYPGAPIQKSTKSIRVSNSSVVAGDEGKEGKRIADGGSVPPSKALVSERRKSLSLVNDASDKPSSSPRSSSGAGISTGPRGVNNTGSRLSNLSAKLEKVAARESTKEPTGAKEFVGRGSSSLPPLSNGGGPLKNGHKGVKTNSYLHSSSAKGNAAAANFAKVPAASTTQRLVTGGTAARSSRTVHTGAGNSPASHGPIPVPTKGLRQGVPENRQKTKTEVSGRGGKPSRD